MSIVLANAGKICHEVDIVLAINNLIKTNRKCLAYLAGPEQKQTNTNTVKSSLEQNARTPNSSTFYILESGFKNTAGSNTALQ